MLYVKNIRNLDVCLLLVLAITTLAYLGPFFLAKNSIHFVRSFAIILLIIYVIKIKSQFKYSGNQLDKDIRIVIKMFLIWNIIIIVRGLLSSDNFRDYFLLLTTPESCWAYLTPIVCYISITNELLYKFAKWSIINIVISIIFTWLFREIVFVGSEDAIDVEKGLTVYNYLSIAQLISAAFGGIVFYWINNNLRKGTRFFLWITLFLGVFSALLLGRRSSAGALILYLFMFMVYLLRFRTRWLFFFVIISIIGLQLFQMYESQIENFLPMLFERLTVDTRSGVEEDFYNDMHLLDWIFGRGAMGLVYSSNLGYRSMIETGYLNIILHGGIIALCLYIYILFVSAIRGFYSRNKLAIAMSLYLFSRIILLYPSGHIKLDYATIAMWICIAYCSNKNLRNSDFSINKI